MGRAGLEVAQDAGVTLDLSRIERTAVAQVEGPHARAHEAFELGGHARGRLLERRPDDVSCPNNVPQEHARRNQVSHEHLVRRASRHPTTAECKLGSVIGFALTEGPRGEPWLLALTRAGAGVVLSAMVITAKGWRVSARGAGNGSTCGWAR